MTSSRPGASRSYVRALLSVLSIAGVLALMSPALAAGRPVQHQRPKAPGVTFGIGPASAAGIDGRPLLNYTASPGAALTDHVAVVNLSAKPIHVRVYPVDAVPGANGATGYEPAATKPTDAGSWITVHTARPGAVMLLRGRATRVIPISVAIPSNASPGDHVAGIIASLTSRITSQSGERVKFEQRVALRTDLRVSGPLRPVLAIENLAAQYHGTLNPFAAGWASVSYTVHNTGNVTLGATQAVTISGLFGTTGRAVSVAHVPLLLPGASLPVKVRVDGVWPELVMHASVSVKPVGAAGAANPVLPVNTARTSFWAVPWTLLTIALAVVALLIGRLWWRRAHPRTARHRPKANRQPVLAGKA